MKRILKLLGCIVIVAIIATMINITTIAAGSTIAFSKSTLNVGETVTVTIRLNPPKSFESYDIKIRYESDILELTNAGNGNMESSGVVYIANFTNTAKAVETISFKAKKAGNAVIRIIEANYSDGMEMYSLDGCSASISVVDKSATKSSDANLKYITPSAGALTPKFSPNVTSYTITVPYSVTVLTLGAGTSNSGADWDVEGSKNMKVGSNKRVIIVTAEDGTQKKYTLNITRLAEDGSANDGTSSTDAPTETVSVTADGKDMVISNNFDTTNLFVGYSVNTYMYNSVEFPCIEKGDTKLLYLTDANGENGGFYRPLEDGSFEKFSYMLTKAGFYEFLKATEIPEGYSEIALSIDDQKITAYQSSDPTVIEFALVYAKGPDGYTGFYRYDTVEHTLQRAIGAIVTGTVAKPDADEDTDNNASGGNILDNILSLDTNTKIVAIAIVGIILLLIVAIIVLIVKIARPSVYEEDYEDDEEDDKEDDELSDFDLISISDRDGEEETIEL